MSADDTMVAAYGTKFDQSKYCSDTGYIFVVRADDGHYVAGVH